MTTLTVAGSVPEWTLGDRLRKARESAGMNQSTLAETTGISRRSISSYESSEAMPKRPQLIAWALATGVPLEWLETGAESPRPVGPDGGSHEVRHQGLEPRTRWFGASAPVVSLLERAA